MQEEEQDTFFGCYKCPNKVFSNARSLEVHKLKHENPEFTEKNIIEKLPVIPKFVQLTSYPDILKRDNVLSGVRKQNKPKEIPSTLPEIIQKLLEKKIVNIHWCCKFCDLDKFPTVHKAKIHVDLNHSNLMEADLIKHIRKCKNKKVVNKWICRVCGSSTYNEKKVSRCYKKHSDLFDNTNPLIKSKRLFISLILKKYHCLLCKIDVQKPKSVRNHMSQKHVNIFREYFWCPKGFPFTESQSEYTDGDNIIVKNLLSKMGITIFSRTSGLQRYKLKQLPKVVHNCALCPHTIIFLEDQIPYHMWSKHGLKENYYKLVTSIPTSIIMDFSSTETNIFNCPCQYTTFSREILSLPVINMSFKNNPAADKVNEETKLMWIYKSQFVYHNKYKLIISSKCKEKVKRVPQHYVYETISQENSNPILIIDDNIAKDDKKVTEINNPNEFSAPPPTNNEITDEIFIPNNETVEDCNVREDSMDIFKLSGDVDSSQVHIDDEDKIEISFDDIKSINESLKNDLLHMKNFIKKAGVSDEKSIMKSRIVHKVPKEVYSCFLCPHLTIFSSDDLKFHMNRSHNLTEDYSKLISIVAVNSVIENKYMNKDEIVFILSCLCQHASFNKEVLTMPVIDRIYEEIIETPEGNDINTETKLLKIYNYQFKCHCKHKLTILSNDEGKKQKLYFDFE
ncbi:uncharacterized protein LOC130901941 [Diorhabda carinulata]|uniref:uncharacterized protein LOC130901941 n=1 Tax=Diorhabda carinulata TaxID=1163345 RepID=UPI0025A28E32|nr:uncharacterized protein LOC130901941 [Diorhabda carinulata]XP_057669636.1 uncharacterized protein LOC130901941 [Diorhabda carinulata]